MKVGDKVRSTKVRPKETATIVKADINIREGDELKPKKEIRSTYTAKFDDGSSLIFYGFDIGRSVFKVEDDDGQITLDQFINM